MNPEASAADRIAAGRLADLNPSPPLDVARHRQHPRLTAPALAGLSRALRPAARGALSRTTPSRA